MTEGQEVPALILRGVSHRYGRRLALDDVSFEVPRGAFTALLGPNGAGKSTLFALMTRLFEASSGRIAIMGHDLKRDPTRALSHLGVVFQDPTLDLDLTVLQNLRYAAALHGVRRREADRRIERELDRFGLGARRHDKARTLNGGHRRRIEIARALMHDPALLLLDEPTVGLDVPTRRDLVEEVHHLCREAELAVLWATHLVDEIDRSGDRIVLLHQGRVAGAGEAETVLKTHEAADLGDLFERLAAAS